MNRSPLVLPCDRASLPRKDILMSTLKYAKAIKEPGTLSPRVKWLRDYYFSGTDRKWNNE